MVETSNVEIYVWSYCPFCHKALDLLEKKGIPYKKHVMDDKEDELNKLRQKTNHRSVPQIFIKGNFIGGCDELCLLEDENKLDSLVK